MNQEVKVFNIIACNMKKFVVFLCLLSGIIANAYAQDISLKSVSLKQSDLRASTNPRTDNNGKTCAVVKVNVIGVKDLQFIDAVGNVDYNLGEYIVYVPEGIKELKYKNSSGSISGVVNFDDYGLEVETKRVYNVVFESENHIRAAIFSIQPQNANLVFDGNEVALDENGLAAIEKPIGKYNYSINAKGYERQEGVVDLSEEDLFTTTNVNLKQKMYPLVITSSPLDALLFIDNIPYGKLSEINDLKVPEGEHSIRLTATGYEEFEQSVMVEGKVSYINASLQQMKEQTIKYKDERTRTSVNIRNGAYVSLGAELYDKEKYEGHDWGAKVDLSFIQHFGALFAAREGVGGGLMNRNKKWVEEKLVEKIDTVKLSWFIEVPLQLGISFPFGKYNKNLFSVFGGGYGKAIFTELVKENRKEEKETIWDYGLRLTAQIDINKFVFGGEFSSSLKGFGTFWGVRIGYKF